MIDRDIQRLDQARTATRDDTNCDVVYTHSVQNIIGLGSFEHIEGHKPWPAPKHCNDLLLQPFNHVG